MKRTVKAWARKRPVFWMPGTTHRIIFRRNEGSHPDHGECIPITITYDDGRPAPRKRKGGAR